MPTGHAGGEKRNLVPAGDAEFPIVFDAFVPASKESNESLSF